MWLFTVYFARRFSAVTVVRFVIVGVKDSSSSLLIQESHAVAGKPRDAAVNSDRYQQPVGQKQSEWETENIT